MCGKRVVPCRAHRSAGQPETRTRLPAVNARKSDGREGPWEISHSSQASGPKSRAFRQECEILAGDPASAAQPLRRPASRERGAWPAAGEEPGSRRRRWHSRHGRWYRSSRRGSLLELFGVPHCAPCRLQPGPPTGNLGTAPHVRDRGGSVPAREHTLRWSRRRPAQPKPRLKTAGPTIAGSRCAWILYLNQLACITMFADCADIKAISAILPPSIHLQRRHSGRHPTQALHLRALSSVRRFASCLRRRPPTGR